MNNNNNYGLTTLVTLALCFYIILLEPSWGWKLRSRSNIISWATIEKHNPRRRLEPRYLNSSVFAENYNAEPAASGRYDQFHGLVLLEVSPKNDVISLPRITSDGPMGHYLEHHYPGRHYNGVMHYPESIF